MAGRKPLVLVPGLLCDALLWSAQVAELAKAADAWVADHTRQDSTAAIAEALLREAPFERFALAGLSMGGYVALEVWRQAPGRVERLALLDTSPLPDSPESTRNRERQIALARASGVTAVSDELLPKLVRPRAAGDPRLAALVRTMARNTGVEAFVREERAIIGRADSRPTLPTIACATLVLCGREDQLTPVQLHEDMAAAIPGAALAVIDDCGHLSALEAPERVSAALGRWLAS